MSTDVDQFLSSLKRFNNAGVINMLGVIATFTVALIALAPSIRKWWKRPKLAIQLKPVTIANVPGHQRLSVTSQPIAPEITTTAGVLIHNTGASVLFGCAV